jgi:hypothetical protein
MSSPGPLTQQEMEEKLAAIKAAQVAADNQNVERINAARLKESNDKFQIEWARAIDTLRGNRFIMTKDGPRSKLDEAIDAAVRAGNQEVASYNDFRSVMNSILVLLNPLVDALSADSELWWKETKVSQFMSQCGHQLSDFMFLPKAKSSGSPAGLFYSATVDDKGVQIDDAHDSHGAVSSDKTKAGLQAILITWLVNERGYRLCDEAGITSLFDPTTRKKIDQMGLAEELIKGDFRGYLRAMSPVVIEQAPPPPKEDEPAPAAPGVGGP